MLCLEERVTEDVWVGCHRYVFVCGHDLPDLVKEGEIVDAHGRSDAFVETYPVLIDDIGSETGRVGRESEANFGVIALGPFVERGVET